MQSHSNSTDDRAQPSNEKYDKPSRNYFRSAKKKAQGLLSRLKAATLKVDQLVKGHADMTHRIAQEGGPGFQMSRHVELVECGCLRYLRRVRSRTFRAVVSAVTGEEADAEEAEPGAQ